MYNYNSSDAKSLDPNEIQPEMGSILSFYLEDTN